MQFTQYTQKSIADVLAEFRVTSELGLSHAQALSKLKRFGPNEIKGHKAPWKKILIRQFATPFVYLLMGAAILAFFLNGYIDSFMILLFILINAGLGFYQEYKSEQTIRLLDKYVNRRALARRDGKETVIVSKELVVGDIVIVETGDIIPADLRLIEEEQLVVNESVLTGESVPVNKTAKAIDEITAQPYEAVNIAFSGSLVEEGRGVGVVVATGKNTVMGSVARLATETQRVSSFEKGVSKFSAFILRLIIITLVFVFVANLFIKGGRTSVAELIVFSIALAVSVIPEALPLVTTFSLSQGAMRLAKRKVVARRLSAIEDLGSIEILCTDKTGTLTENELTVQDVFSFNQESEVIKYASLAATYTGEKRHQPNNAFDLALWKKLSAHELKALDEFERMNEAPFDPERRRNSVLVMGHGSYELIVRGAYEDILELSDNLHHQRRSEIDRWIEQRGKEGKRIIAVAVKPVSGSAYQDLRDEEHHLHFMGLVAFFDPLKRTSEEAIAKARKLGIKTKILTGDSPEVAGAVAYQVGLVDSPSRVITGKAFDALDPAARRRAVMEYHVFARVTPQQKYAIIELLQVGHEVGFLGEGINDAPALKIANVAIVVHEASDIARDSADIILLKKSLNVIIDGIEEGRRVFANTIKYIQATLASNFGNFYAVAIASLLIDFLPMLPLQILLVNLLSDFPMIAVATDSVDPEELKRPKHYNIRDIVFLATILGLVSTVFDFIFFAIFSRISEGVLQTNWFIASILTELVFLFSIRTRLFFTRTRRPSWLLIILSTCAAVATVVLPFTFFGQNTFKFIQPEPWHLTLIFVIIAFYFAITETVKLTYFRFARQSGHARAG